MGRLLGLRKFLDELPARFRKVVQCRALEVRDANWKSWAVARWNAGDRNPSSGTGAKPLSWETVRSNGHLPCELGPYVAYPAKRGVPRPWTSIRAVPGNVPYHSNVFSPGLLPGGGGWPRSLEVVVTREIAPGGGHDDREASVDGDSCVREPLADDCDDRYPTAYMWLVEDGWVRDRPRVVSPKVGLCSFGSSASDVIVMGQPRWQLEFAVAVILSRADVLSRRQQDAVIEDLATRLLGRVGEHWQDDQQRFPLARGLARRHFEHLVSSYHRPLFTRSLGGTFKFGSRDRAHAHAPLPSIESARSGTILGGNVEKASDLAGDSPDDLADLLMIFEKVLSALDANQPAIVKELESRSGLDREDVEMALQVLLELGVVRLNSNEGYVRGPDACGLFTRDC